MERAAFVSESVLAGSELTEVLGGLWNNIIEQFEDDAASVLAADGDIKLDVNQIPTARQRSGLVHPTKHHYVRRR